MKNRLEKFMKMEGLSSSRLAEIMGVQPSSISHLLGGRNKPSFDFVEKMLLRFPKINPDWLILGKGSIYRTSVDQMIQTPNISLEEQSTLPILSTVSDEYLSQLEKMSKPDIEVKVSAQKVDVLYKTEEANSDSNSLFDSLSTDDLEKMSKPDIEVKVPAQITPTASRTEKTIIEDQSSINQNKTSSKEVQTKYSAELKKADTETEVEKIVLFMNDHTFITYRPR